MSKEMKLIMERFQRAMSEQAMQSVGMPLIVGKDTKMGQQDAAEMRYSETFQRFAKSAGTRMLEIADEIEEAADRPYRGTGKDFSCDPIPVFIEPGDICLWPKEEFSEDGARAAVSVLEELQNQYNKLLNAAPYARPNSIKLNTRFMLTMHRVSSEYTYHCIVTAAKNGQGPGETLADPCVLCEAIRRVGRMLKNGAFAIDIELNVGP